VLLSLLLMAFIAPRIILPIGASKPPTMIYGWEKLFMAL